MGSSFEVTSVMRPLRAAAVLMIGALLAPLSARAEIILDDFDESFEIILPEDLTCASCGFEVQQFGVGPLGAERRIDVIPLLATPSGRVDANLSQASALTVTIDRLNPNPTGGLPIIGVNLLYFFDETDITQGGVNDRVVVDFAFLHSAIPIARVDVFIQDASQPGISYVKEVYDIPPQDEPFRLEFPLDSFGVRGGGAGGIDYQRVYRATLSISPARFTEIDQLDFSTAIERVRFTHAVPDPYTSALVCCCVFSLSLSWKRRWSHEDQFCAVNYRRSIDHFHGQLQSGGAANGGNDKCGGRRVDATGSRQHA